MDLGVNACRGSFSVRRDAILRLPSILGGGTMYHFWKRTKLYCPIDDWAAAFWIFVIVTRRINQSQRDSAAQPERNRAQPQCGVQINPAVAGHALQIA
jgi:hypothetical protein